VRENLASLLAMLYVWNDRSASGSVVREWCEHPSAHETELTSAITAIRSALVDGYAEDAPAKEGYRHRGQALLAHVVDKTSDWLAVYARNPDERLKEQEEAKSVAKVWITVATSFTSLRERFMRRTHASQPASLRPKRRFDS